MATKIDALYIAQRLGGMRVSGSGYMARCPAHDDHNASLYVADGGDGSIALKCHVDCSYRDIVAALKPRGLWPELQRKEKLGAASQGNDGGWEVVAPIPKGAPKLDYVKVVGYEPTLKHIYRDENGEPVGIVARRDRDGGKDIRPAVLTRHKDTGEYRWAAKGMPRPRTLYGLHELAARVEAPVLAVEGEKTADAAAKLFPDHVVVTWAGGAKGLEYTDFGPLKGRVVKLWPDNDEAGKQAMNDLAVILKAQGAVSASVVVPPETLPAKWDLADEVPGGVDVQALLAAATETQMGLRPHVLSASALARLPITPREYIVEPFLPTASMSMVYAERGIGKTWFALSMCVTVSRGDDFIGYNVPQERRVLYIDGEMALYDLQSRIIALDEGENENLFLLPSERLFRLDRPLNINTPEDQARVVDVIEQLGREGRLPDLVVFDNLSSLSAGTDENDNSALDALLQWLISLRHKQLAILLVHHAGKSGDQRGASRREDLLDTSIRLSRPKPQKRGKGSEDDDDGLADHNGAHFILEFVKTRGRRPEPHELKMYLREGENGKVKWDIGGADDPTAAEKVLRYIALKYPSQQSHIVEGMRLSKGSVSQKCKALREAGFIDDRLNVTPDGRKRIIELWPELDTQLMRQESIPI